MPDLDHAVGRRRSAVTTRSRAVCFTPAPFAAPIEFFGVLKDIAGLAIVRAELTSRHVHARKDQQ
jgi:hypothetical protein